jgi:uncharacterized membrane protein
MIPRDRRRDEDVPSGLAHRYGTARMEAFSDGVFAIAITLLVLEIGLPPNANEDLLGAILAQWPSYLAFAVSFSTIGAIWIAHSAITEHLDRADPNLLRLNLLLLLVVSFLPFPTRLLAEHIEFRDAERVAVTIYGVWLLFASAMLSVLWRYALHAKLISDTSRDEEIQLLTRRLTPGLAGYLVLLATGLVVPFVAVIGYLAIAIFFLVPARTLRAVRKRSG